MLKRRITKLFPVIYLYDPALDALPDDTIAEYHKSGRDIEVLGDLSKLPELPTIFECRPLMVKYEHLADQLQERESSAAWQLFKTHVANVRNLPDDQDGALLRWTDAPNAVIEEDCRGKIPRDVKNDIAGVIVQAANEVSQGFTLPVGFWAARAHLRARRVLDVSITEPTDVMPNLD